MRNIIAAAIVAITGVFASTSGGTDTPTCYEDQVIAWQGSSNTHAVCVDADDPALRQSITNAAQR
jgi:hypothetical protein